MPAKAPKISNKSIKRLTQIGEQIRVQRKSLGSSAVATAESAGVSRMTLNRIEHGEPSVTMGAYLSVVNVLGLELNIFDEQQRLEPERRAAIAAGFKINLTDYPQLKKLSWQIKDSESITLEEALNIYERNWRHIDLKKMKEKERQFLRELLVIFGREKLLV